MCWFEKSHESEIGFGRFGGPPLGSSTKVLYRVGARRLGGDRRGEARLLLAALEDVPEVVGRVAEGVDEEHLSRASEGEV